MLNLSGIFIKKRLLQFLVCYSILFLIGFPMMAQDIDLDKLMQQETKKDSVKKNEKILNTFLTTRISNGHSVETLPAGVMDVKIQHRFGTLNSGIGQLFGLDQATIRIGADYGITNNLMVGFGRASFQKQLDGFLKYKIWSQKESGTPVTITSLASVMLRTDPFDANLPYKPNYSDRLAYAFQIMIARKFSDGISLQLMPTIVHNNIVPTSNDPNDIISMGAGGSFQLSKSTRFNIEYYYNLQGYKFENTQNSMSMGFDIGTGGHVFQLVFTNGQGIAERPFITETSGDFFGGDIHFGFNISRLFQIGGKSKK